jgi:hypothetical protein
VGWKYVIYEAAVSAREEDSSFPRTLGRERTPMGDWIL